MGFDVPASAAGAPVAALILLDVTRGMSSEQLGAAKDGALAVWRMLRRVDSLSVACVGAMSAPALTSSVKARVEEEDVARFLASIPGESHLRRSLEDARRSARSPTRPPGSLRVLLVTTGHIVALERDGLLAEADQLRAPGAALDIILAGAAPREGYPLLCELWERGGGSFCYAPDAEQLQRQLQDLLDEAQRARAPECELLVTSIHRVELDFDVGAADVDPGEVQIAEIWAVASIGGQRVETEPVRLAIAFADPGPRTQHVDREVGKL